MSMNIKTDNELPEELMLDIALRLPVKSICRLRCVSKEWNIFLQSPEFAKSHLRLTISRSDEIIFKGRFALTPYVITLANGSAKCRRLEVKCDNAVLGSCNGLVLHEAKHELVVMNPITLRAKTIPKRLMFEPNWTPLSFGLGYNDVDDDYKIVVMCSCVNGVKRTCAFIFSLRTGSCKKLADCPFVSMDHLRPGVYIGGCLYWLVSHEEKPAIFAFDLSTEKFEEVASPIRFDPRYSYALCVIGGCLALKKKRYYYVYSIDRFLMRPIDVWIMEKPRYWRKFTIANYPPRKFRDDDEYDVVCRIGESEFLLTKINVKFKLVAYNYDTGIWRDLDIHGLPQNFGWILTFRVSLVCPEIGLP